MNIFRLGIILMIVSAISAGALAYVYFQTKPIIEEQKIKASKTLLLKVLPGANSFKELDLLSIAPFSDSVMKILNIYSGYNADNQFIGIVVKGSNPGYAGPIILMIGINKEDQITGLQIVEHKETPGLGSKITEAGFTGMFTDKKLTEPLTINEDLDSIAGATKSAVAVARLVKEIAEYVITNKEVLEE